MNLTNTMRVIARHKILLIVGVLIAAAAAYVTIVLLAERKRRSRSFDVRSGWGRTAEPARVPGGAPARVPAQRRPAGDLAEPAPAREHGAAVRDQ